jgi:AraC-like DNA-binding protein
MQMAIRYLRETQKSIEQISMLVGYEYAAHFITAFKRRFRITPLEFRIREKKR